MRNYINAIIVLDFLIQCTSWFSYRKLIVENPLLKWLWQNLNRHHRGHSEESSYQCSHCKKIFAQRNNIVTVTVTRIFANITSQWQHSPCINCTFWFGAHLFAHTGDVLVSVIISSFTTDMKFIFNIHSNQQDKLRLIL